MKGVSLASLAVSAVSAQATFDTISYRFRDSVEQVAALFLQDATFAGQVFSHGCWCAKLNDPSSVNLGGNAPVDELDQICKDWARARRCSRTSGSSCEFASYDSSYEVERDNGNVLCPDSDACMAETCQIDVHFIGLINDWQIANPGTFSPVTNPVCPLHTTSQLNNCQSFSTTVRPATVANDVQDALDNAGVDNSDKNIAVTLSWVNTNGEFCDFDLWVADPSGEETGFSNNPSGSGGTLDVDQMGDISGFTYIENISWAVAASGEYNARVHIWRGCAGITEVNVYVHLDGVSTLTVLPITDTWNQGPVFQYDSSSRFVLPAYTGPQPDYNAPKNKA